MPTGSQNKRLTKPHNQRGQALIAITALLGTTLLVTVYTMTQPTNQAAIDNQKTSGALAQAKTALIGYAASLGDPPGALPCPDTDDDGESNPPSGGGCVALLGRLPWKTLGLSDLRDSSGERLWYALSSKFQGGSPIASNTSGQLTIADNGSGVVIQTGIIAIIFSAGPALNGQPRNGAGENTAANYLDGENANGGDNYVSGSPTDGFNDTILAITSHDLFSVVDKGLFAQLAGDSMSAAGLQWYLSNHGNYPCAAADGDGTSAMSPPCPTTPGFVPYSDLKIDADAAPWSSGGWLTNGAMDYAVTETPAGPQVSVRFYSVNNTSVLTTCTADSSGRTCY
jgi:hypothetical protein